MNLDDSLKNEYSVFKEILDKVDVGIMIIDSKGIIIYYNEVAGKIDGLKAADVIGKHVSEVYPQIQESTLLQVQKTKKPIIDQPQTYKTWHGKTVNILCSTFPLTYQKRIVGAVDISRDITQIKELSEQNVALKEELLKTHKIGRKKTSSGAPYTFDDIITNDPVLNHMKKIGRRISGSDSPVLIYGETGTGKELFAQSIHNHGYKKGPFIAQNCAALPGSLLESILFGTVKGSFTGSEDRQGLIELADEGTLFLDEINSIPLDLQAKLLRFLQEGTFRRVGDLRLRSVNVRVIACTNMEPEEAVKQKQLRSDLFYRLNAIYLELPPLRERKSDVPLLVDYFVSIFNQKLGLHITGVAANVLQILENYFWPGNVRELEHCIEHAMNVGLGQEITLSDLPSNILKSSAANPISLLDMLPDAQKNQTLNQCLDEVEKKLILRTLKNCQGNISRASEILGVPRQTLHYRLKVLGIPTHRAFQDQG
ncbi:sigma-54 interaction domain-containing protein [Candidatus Formimonas warabiya]|uniref:PAS domain S-box protein n=1 Tax=Formimonas warabiya TaxID=1761012 RepID=A0A3G1KZ38_FORW1|nr:sigma 54-interacting transcriptional regulator [Candidatus Formimonas warabiya]ATW27647.1 hypothetical protein DCMF_25395 [Candidatus Formimonas warabiya]